ncbi:MAG: queuosine precursor transporter [bacterium]|nr:queuosine precursor transporter [bacterium]
MNYKHFSTITGLFVAVLLISNVASTKIIDFVWFTFDGGTLLFPLAYIFGDILTEVYGYKQSRKVIWIGFASALLMALTFIIIGKLPAAGDWPYQDAYDAILGLTPRIVIASLIAYWLGEFSNAFVLAKLKVWSEGKSFWLRAIGSTVVGQGLDTVVFVLIAFAGVLSPGLLITVIVSNYVFKLLVEVLLLPVTYRIVNWLKQIEKVDYLDKDTNFNPFKF